MGTGRSPLLVLCTETLLGKSRKTYEERFHRRSERELRRIFIKNKDFIVMSKIFFNFVRSMTFVILARRIINRAFGASDFVLSTPYVRFAGESNGKYFDSAANIETRIFCK